MGATACLSANDSSAIGMAEDRQVKRQGSNVAGLGERILLGMTYGEFGAVLNTQDNSHIAELLNHNVVLEMDGLSSS